MNKTGYNLENNVLHTNNVTARDIKILPILNPLGKKFTVLWGKKGRFGEKTEICAILVFLSDLNFFC